MRRRIFVTLIFTILSLRLLVASSYKLESTLEYKAAKEYCKSIEYRVDDIASRFKLNSKLLLPIIFPECMRFSETKNLIETNTLELFYTNFGKEYSDFSIGRFQMKPSFVEAMELFVLQDKELRKEFEFLLMQEDCKGVRALRLERLKDISWQVIYLCCFYKIVDKRFRNLNFDTMAKKVHFYATAYNVGFTMKTEEIQKWQTIYSFPSGKINGENNYPYGFVAQEYFNDTNP